MADLPPDTLNEIGVLKRREIMQGASHCDFGFKLKKSAAS